MPSVMCSLSAVQSHGSWPPFHGTDAMNEHDGGRHHFLAMGLLSGLKSAQKQEAAAGMCRTRPVLLVLAAALCATGP